MNSLKNIVTLVFCLVVSPSFLIAQHTYEGTASFYSMLFNGKSTSNGERLNNDDFTCAHPNLPYNTFVRVTNSKNGKKVVVRVTDRFVQHGNHLIDLTRKAAEQIDMIRDGRTSIVLEVLTPEFVRNLNKGLFNIVRLEPFKFTSLPNSESRLPTLQLVLDRITP